MKDGNGAGGRTLSAQKAWATRRSPKYKARKSEQVSKLALAAWCRANRWKMIAFEGEDGDPRTGIVDAIIARIRPDNADALEIRLVQLKSGSAGLTGREIRRLKGALKLLAVDWLLAAFDGESLHLLPDIPSKGAKKPT